MVIAEQRLPLAFTVRKPEEIRVQRIRQIARAAAGIERVGGAIEERPLLEDEVLPGILVAGRAGAGKREIFEMKRAEVALERSRFREPAGVCVPGARLERCGEQIE